jgi:Cd2+/Zn2+-exporting ATPase/cation-transporting ATPase G
LKADLWRVTEIRIASFAGILILIAKVIETLSTPSLLISIIEIAALVMAASTFTPHAFTSIFRGEIGVGTLMTIAAIGAVALGKIEEAALLSILYTISEGLEEFSLEKTKRGLRSLLDLVPLEATLLRDGKEIKISPNDLVPGDHLVIRPGERFAADCRIITGRTSLDTSALTGESMPVEATVGDEVFAGTINGSGPLEVEVTTKAENNSLAKIVHIVEKEQSRRGPSQRLADTIAGKLVPGIMVLSSMIIIYGFIVHEPILWLERALVVLVAASPCALAISIPITVVAAVGASTRIGVLIKGGGALESLGKVRTIALDKTGTLTANKPVVIDVATVDSVSREYLLSIAAGLESRSEHPLAAAIIAATSEKSEILDVENVSGEGIQGKYRGRTIRLGRPGWIDAGSLSQEVSRLQDLGATAVLVEEDGKVIGVIAVRDELRPEAKDVISHLNEDGYTTIMLTGDNQRVASSLGASLGMSQVHADLRPEEKAELVRTFRSQNITAMVGDGINDAPALATADVGIAMGAMGADVAIETADVALMGENLQSLFEVLDHARRTRKIMLQNVGMSLALIGLLIPLAMFGILGLATVVLIHEVAEIFVIANGIRAGRIFKHD